MSAQNKTHPQGIVFDLFRTLVDPDELIPRDFHKIQKIAELFNLNAEDFLAASASFSFFQKLGDEIITGATGTNVRDLRVLLCKRQKLGGSQKTRFN